MDRLKSLEVFGRVVETGGFSAAARKLNMSTTMVANHIQALEDSLGVRLLQRTTRKVSVTETGKFFYDRSSAILMDLEEANEATAALSSMPRGSLRIYTNSSMIKSLGPITDEFLERHPQVTISLDVGERMIDMIDAGYDLAIRMIMPEANLIVRKLATWRHLPVCAPEYIERHGEPESPGDLLGHNCLQYSLYAYGDLWRFIGPQGAVVEAKVKGNVVSSSADLLLDLALRGRGIFLAPAPVVSEEIAAGRLVHIMKAHKGVEFALSAAFPNRNYLPTKVRLFIDLLAERLSKLPQFAG
ncbi:LysR family transcriptional regulator [Neorhizobium sp. Rsf11]|uniref:LysR family transcriptional regulator n=2 Tax=Neorhizobium TaxID=1525371 RepID=A0ABV0LZ75_9HYPH|nr:LysR family transcriptional regulator [Neorhizobium petrolearium]MCC2610943.1 LysR family transcriptional regulator [Neorhizobium petrolearium]WGI66164.1 LysR family transcriptional regulator [Neorhizobium petrolearium]